MKKQPFTFWLAVIVLAVYFCMLFGQIAKQSFAGVSCSVPNTFSNGTTADATQVNANFSALVACFANSAASGANSDITSLTGLTTPLSAGQGGTQYFWGGTSTGSANVQVITTVAPTTGLSLTVGTRVSFIPGATNTGIATVNINGTGVKPLGRLVQGSTGITTTASLVGGELLASSLVVDVVWNGSTWTIVNQGIAYVGEIKDFGYAGCPTGWQEVTGGNVSATNFPDINTALGTTWGASGGNTVMPDLRGRTTFSRDGTGTRLTTDQSGALAGNTVGTTGGLQNQTLTNAQLPVFSQTPTFTGAGTFTPTITANYTPGNIALNSTGIVQYAGGGAFSGSTEFTVSASGTRAPAASSPGTFNQIAPNSSIPSYTPTLNAITVANMNNFAITAVTFGSGNSHPVTPPLGIVTKCVKL